MDDADELAVEEYATSLRDLDRMNEPLIKHLRRLAKKNIIIAPLIVWTFEKHLQKVSVDRKYPVFALIDSILRNVGKVYPALFLENLASMFCEAYVNMNEETRFEMYKLRNSWIDVFPEWELRRLDQRVATVDRAWPYASAPVPVTINNRATHLNRKGTDSPSQTVVVEPVASTSQASHVACSPTIPSINGAQVRDQSQTVVMEPVASTSQASHVACSPTTPSINGAQVRDQSQTVVVEPVASTSQASHVACSPTTPSINGAQVRDQCRKKKKKKHRKDKKRSKDKDKPKKSKSHRQPESHLCNPILTNPVDEILVKPMQDVEPEVLPTLPSKRLVPNASGDEPSQKNWKAEGDSVLSSRKDVGIRQLPQPQLPVMTSPPAPQLAAISDNSMITSPASSQKHTLARESSPLAFKVFRPSSPKPAFSKKKSSKENSQSLAKLKCESLFRSPTKSLSPRPILGNQNCSPLDSFIQHSSPLSYWVEPDAGKEIHKDSDIRSSDCNHEFCDIACLRIGERKPKPKPAVTPEQKPELRSDTSDFMPPKLQLMDVHKTPQEPLVELKIQPPQPEPHPEPNSEWGYEVLESPITPPPSPPSKSPHPLQSLQLVKPLSPYQPSIVPVRSPLQRRLSPMRNRVAERQEGPRMIPEHQRRSPARSPLGPIGSRSVIRPGMTLGRDPLQKENLQTASLSNEDLNLDEPFDESVAAGILDISNDDSKNEDAEKEETGPEDFAKPGPSKVEKRPVSKSVNRSDQPHHCKRNKRSKHSNRHDENSSDSGDSADEHSSAHIYKQYLLDISNCIKNNLKPTQFRPAPRLRLFEQYGKCYEMPDEFWNSEKFQQILADANREMCGELSDHDYAFYKGIVDIMVVPLFRGIPFKDRQFTNCDLKQILGKFSEINKKLLDAYVSGSREESPLSDNEKVLIGLHSRTALKKVGLESSFELMLMMEEDLYILKEEEEELFQNIEDDAFSQDTRSAIKDHVFNFSEKSDFPIISMSKAPDHPIRFAMGMDVEAKKKTIKGKAPMEAFKPRRPNYKQGYPRHRITGLLYITMHKLAEFITQRAEHNLVDVNYSVKKGEIPQGKAFTRYMTQHEVDFLGKIDSNTIVGVIPIVYPHVREDGKFDVDYLQEIYGINIKAKDSKCVSSPVKLKQILTENSNIMSPDGRIVGLGKIMIPTVVNLANGIVTAFARNKGLMLCTVTDTNHLQTYPIRCDRSGSQFSEVQQDLNSNKQGDTHPETRLWECVALQLQKEKMEDNNNVKMQSKQ